ncbi:MAG: ABC transporter substrate-binding protein [Clostridia bacterium]
MRQGNRKLWAVLLALMIALTCMPALAQEAAPTAQRIICLAPSSVEIVYALGRAGDIVGWSQYTDYPPEVTEVPGWIPYEQYAFQSVEDELKKQVAVVSSFMDCNMEVIEALKPTLILACESTQETMAKDLEAKGYKVLFHNPQTLDDVFQMMLDVGEAIGAKTEAETLVTAQRAEVAEIQAITEKLPRVKVYLEIAHRMGDYGPYATGAGSPMDQIIAVAGGENIFADVASSAFATDYPDIVARNPDVILSPMWPNAGREEVTTVREIVMREGFENIAAVQNDRVYHYDSSLLKRPGPRQVTAIRKLAYLLHPYSFSNPENSVSPWELGKIDETYPSEKPLR